jgi:hypothetical protein
MRNVVYFIVIGLNDETASGSTASPRAGYKKRGIFDRFGAAPRRPRIRTGNGVFLILRHAKGEVYHPRRRRCLMPGNLGGGASPTLSISLTMKTYTAGPLILLFTVSRSPLILASTLHFFT